DLKPRARVPLDRAILEACSGAQTLIERARRALREGQDQLVLELTDIVLGTRPQSQEARITRMKALRRLGAAAKNGVERNIDLTAAEAIASGRRSGDGFQAATDRRERQWEDGSERGVPTALTQKSLGSCQETLRCKRSRVRPVSPLALRGRVEGAG